ncbi:MAG: efflux RND transporter periplasmic adaptor subunit [Croceivirga sp.]
MKRILQLSILAILAASCGSKTTGSVEDIIASTDIETLSSKRTELNQNLKAIENQVKLLDSAILAISGDVKLPLVSTLTLEAKQFQHYLELQGDVMTDQNVLIYPEMAGTLTRVYVKEGQRVSKGQILGSIDDGGLSSQLAQMRTQLDLAKTTFERQERLWKQNIGSEIQYLQAKTQYKAQESAVAQMESQLGKSTLRAPFTGIVDDVIKDQGTVVSPGPGSEVFRIVNLSNMYVEVEVPEAHLANVTEGKSVEVMFPVLGSTVQSKIRQTGNFINPGNRSFKVEIPVPNKEGTIKPNLTAITKINDYTNESAILIPQSVVSENAVGEQYVYLVEENDKEDSMISKKVILQLGKTQGDYVEVLSGLMSGNQIIVEGARSVRDNQMVKVRNYETTANN